MNIRLTRSHQPQPRRILDFMRLGSYHMWNSPEVRYGILMQTSAYNALIQHCTSDVKREVGGIFLGYIYLYDRREYIGIEHYIKADLASEQPMSLTFTNETWNKIDDQHQMIAPNAFRVGWAHTHPGFGIFLSRPLDEYIQEVWFRELWQIAMVIDPINKEAGFFVRQSSGYLQLDKPSLPIFSIRNRPEEFKQRTTIPEQTPIPFIQQSYAITNENKQDALQTQAPIPFLNDANTTVVSSTDEDDYTARVKSMSSIHQLVDSDTTREDLQKRIEPSPQPNKQQAPVSNQSIVTLLSGSATLSFSILLVITVMYMSNGYSLLHAISYLLMMVGLVFLLLYIYYNQLQVHKSDTGNEWYDYIYNTVWRRFLIGIQSPTISAYLLVTAPYLLLAINFDNVVIHWSFLVVLYLLNLLTLSLLQYSIKSLKK